MSATLQVKSVHGESRGSAPHLLQQTASQHQLLSCTKLRESPCYTRLSPRRISRWQRAQRTAAGPAVVQDRLHLIWRHHPRQLLRRLQRDHPRCLGSALADVMQERAASQRVRRRPATMPAARRPPWATTPLVQYAATCPEPPIGLRHNSPHGLKITGGYQQPPAN